MAESLSEIQWADAFLIACRENRLPGFDVPTEAILLSEIDLLCRQAREDARSRMRAGVAIGLERYNPRQYSIEVLRRLSSIVAATLATGAISSLVRHVIALHSYLGQENSPEFDVAIDLVSALGTFPTNAQVARLYRTLLFDETDAIHFRFAGMLTIGVLRNDSTAFIPAMNRFCQLRSFGSERFHDRTIMRAVFKAVLPASVKHAVEKKSGLSDEANLYVTKWAMNLEVLQNVFVERAGRSASAKRTALEVGSYAAIKSMYTLTKSERGRFSAVQEKHRRTPVHLRKGGNS